MIMLLNFLNTSPIKGLLKKFSNIQCAGQYSISISPFSILSFTKKYMICIFLEFPVHKLHPFPPYASHFDFIDRLNSFLSHNLAHSWRSWTIYFTGHIYPFLPTRIMWSFLRLSFSSKLFCVFFHSSIDFASTVCPIILLCTLYAASIHMYRSESVFALIILLSFILFFTDVRPLFNFFQLSTFLLLTLNRKKRYECFQIRTFPFHYL